MLDPKALLGDNSAGGAVMPLSRLKRRNPRWEEDGPAARREQRVRRAREVAAFTASLVAVLGASGLWLVRIASALGRA